MDGNSDEDTSDAVHALEARVKALEILIETALGKLYATHVDLAEELEELLGPNAVPAGAYDGKTLTAANQLQATIAAAWDRLLAVRAQALLFPREWKRQPRQPGTPRT